MLFVQIGRDDKNIAFRNEFTLFSGQQKTRAQFIFKERTDRFIIALPIGFFPADFRFGVHPDQENILPGNFSDIFMFLKFGRIKPFRRGLSGIPDVK